MRRKIILIISSLVLLLLLTVITNRVFIKRTYGQSDPSLQLWLTMNDTLSDSSANLNHMSCSDCPAYTLQGVIDGAYQFSGSQRLYRTDGDLNGSIPSKSSNASESFTISAWIKMNSLNDRKPIVSKQGDPERGFVFVKESDDKLTLETWPEGKTNPTVVKSSTSLQVNTTYHVAVVFDIQSDTAQIYLNGQADGSSSANVGGPPRANSKDLIVGAYIWNGGYQRNMDGMIDDLRIYSKALSSSEIVQLFSDGITTECGDLVCEYPVETHLNCSQDCSTYCGDYVLQDPNSEGIAEACDGSDFGNFGNGVDQCSLYNSNYESGNLQCNSDCSVDTNYCVLGEGDMHSFNYVVIDDQINGHRVIGDVNSDGKNDIAVVDFRSGYTLIHWYEYPSFQKHTIVDTRSFSDYPLYRSDDGTLADIDEDGDLDFVGRVGPNSDGDGPVVWFENPLPGGNPTQTWQRHDIGINQYTKDISVDDMDKDGKLDIVARENTRVQVYYQNNPTDWVEYEFNIYHHEGMDIGDLDNDGDTDIVLNGFWHENPGVRSNSWSQHNIDNKWYTQDGHGWQDNNSNVHVDDINLDGRLEVLISHSELPGFPASWYETLDPKGIWTEHQFEAVFDYAQTLQSADFDMDGDVDVLIAEFPRYNPGNSPVIVYYNNGDMTWTKEELTREGMYHGQVGDVGSDGDMDIVGVRSFNIPPIEMWENTAADGLTLDSWTYIQVDDQRAKWGDFDQPDWLRYFGLEMGDLTGDGKKDIVSGRYFYRNPGGDMANAWTRIDFGLNVDAALIVDIDGDQYGDVIGMAFPAVYWLEADDAQGNSWIARQISTVTKTGHTNTESYAIGQMITGGKPEIIFGTGDGIEYIETPSDPESGNWPKTLIAPAAYGYPVDDVDGDGLNDVVGTYNGADNTRYLAWWKNPTWARYTIGSTDNGGYGFRGYDKFAITDINGDSKKDIIATEEISTGGDPKDARTFWYEQPALNLGDQNQVWIEHIIAVQHSTNAMDIADMDNDGDIDIITGEHKGTEKLIIWENDGFGSFTGNEVDSGKESHDGARVSDLDGDGDYDIVSIAWDDYQFMHLWRNNSSKVTPTPTSIAGDANGDNQVNIADYSIWITQYLNYNPSPNADPDFNDDVEVDGLDFIIWLTNYSSP